MTPLVVRVLPDVPAIDKTFDYLVPDTVRDQVRVGDEVRIDLHGRRVGGWVLEVGVTPPPGVTVRPLAKLRGRGPGRDLLDLADWAAARWVGRPATLLRTASSDRVVPALPEPRPGARPEPSHPLLARAVAGPRAVLELPPATNLVHVALAAASAGTRSS